MLNQQKKKEVFLPKLDHFFPERPPLVTFKHNQAIQYSKNCKILKKQDISPKKEFIHNSNLTSKSPLYGVNADRKNTRQQEIYGSKSARQNVPQGVNKENNDDIFMKRGKLCTINRKSLHNRIVENSTRVLQESPHQLKFKGIKLQKIKEERKPAICQELSGWNNAEQDSPFRITEHVKSPYFF